jgi:hypothetical protein
MSDKLKNILLVVVFAVFIFGITLINIFKTPTDISKSERRKLAQFPEISKENIIDTKFMSEFEDYALDQFVGRDFFRKIKATFLYNVLGQSDNNQIYIVDGQVSKYNNNLNEAQVSDAGRKFNKIANQFLKNMNIYYSVIPDKNYFLAEENGYPSIDYTVFMDRLKSSTKNMEYIDLFDVLKIDDYYSTDTHWKQEELGNVVKALGDKMKFSEYITNDYQKVEVGDFYGVYNGQAALPLNPDKISYLTNEILKNAEVKIFDATTLSWIPGIMHDESRITANDPYDLFLSGPVQLITIENKDCKREKELYIFRDSYGSSLAPLLTEAYSKITIIDVRYIGTPMLKNFVEFKEGSDALFIYGVDVLNNSSILKVF